jgi:hypothetical protein
MIFLVSLSTSEYSIKRIGENKIDGQLMVIMSLLIPPNAFWKVVRSDQNMTNKYVKLELIPIIFSFKKIILCCL